MGMEDPPFELFPVAPDFERIRKPDPAKIQVTWIGHSSFLIQFAGVNILTDPVYVTSFLPIPAGPKRLTEPVININELPHINYVFISHNHYDHLDKKTILSLPPDQLYFVPLGIKKWFVKNGRTNVREFDWWQEMVVSALKITFVAANHFSSRKVFDKNKTLWGGWIMEIEGKKIYFCGDSGYSPVFKDIGSHYAPFDLSFLPIGAYMPRWFMKPYHMNPPEAVQTHIDIRSKKSIAMHWGTYNMADEPAGEPPLYLRHSLQKAGIPEDEFLVLNPGELFIL
jgi:N-acyl-phosphatidylethanolamine-hydrolysing phospholipase D